MPLKVRCRCGQELVIRYSEWVYFVVGFLVLSLAVNVVVLILVYAHLREFAEIARTAPPATPATVAAEGTDSASPAQPANPAAGGGDSGAVAGARVDDTPAASTGAPHPAGADPADETGPEIATGVAPRVRLVPTTPDPPAEVGRTESIPETGDGASPPASDAPVTAISDAATGVSAEAGAEGASTATAVSEAADPDRGDPDGKDPDAGERLPRLVRMLLADALAGASGSPLSAPVARRLWLSLLDDADERVRLHARDLAPDDVTQVETAPIADEEIDARVDAVIARNATLRCLLDDLQAVRGRGADIVLVVDVTESMDRALARLKSASSALVDGLLWALPNARVGVLFYRDDVATTVDLARDPRAAIEAFRTVTATGGGRDVPEGVFEALKGSLQLGRFAWRADARKTLIFIGDAPPPYEDKDALISLARQAHREGEYRIHAVSVGSWEGWDGVPFFADLARAGGGEAVTIGSADATELVPKVLGLLFPPACRDAPVAALLP